MTLYLLLVSLYKPREQDRKVKWFARVLTTIESNPDMCSTEVHVLKQFPYFNWRQQLVLQLFATFLIMPLKHYCSEVSFFHILCCHHLASWKFFKLSFSSHFQFYQSFEFPWKRTEICVDCIYLTEKLLILSIDSPLLVYNVLGSLGD